MNITDTKDYKKWRARWRNYVLANAVEFMPTYAGKEFDHWEIAPCPSNIDGEDTSFGVYAADEDGTQGDCIFCGENEWQAYSAAVDLIGERWITRGIDYRYVWNK